MSGIVEPNDNFSFDELVLTTPVVITGGNHFIKYLLNEGPLYIQPPNCKLKQGIIKAGKRSYCDLMFTNENENFIRWMENLEIHSRKLIFKNRAKWFETELEEHDIENSFASPLKIFKSGKFYIARVNVPSVLGKNTLKIYDENENIIDGDTLKENENVATILEIQGIRCSPRMFQIDLEIKQLLLLKPVDIFDKCILLKPSKHLEERKMATINIQQPEKENEYKIPEPVIEPEPVLEVNVKLSDGLEEIELEIDSIETHDKICLKKRDDMYYKMYKEALKKARVAKELALRSYLDAKHIKNTYMLTDLSDDSDLDEDLDIYEN